MTTAKIRKETVLRAPNRVGLLAEVTERLYAKSVNVLGIRAWAEDDTGVFLIFTENSRLATEALETLPDSTITSGQVIEAVIPNDRGQLAAVSRVLADANIDVREIHMTAGDALTADLVIRTADDTAALAALEAM
jgi:hypothetical protein